MKRIRKPPYGPNIVRAWFDTVFRYALQGLETERRFLAGRNWTFRFRGRTFEYLGSFAELVPEDARENLEQLVSFFPELAEGIDQHDKREYRLAEGCGFYLGAILAHPSFRDVFESVRRDAPVQLGREFSVFFGAYSSEADFMGILAEYMVNNIETQPHHYSTADLWNRYHERFYALLTAPELSIAREANEASGDAMLASVEALTVSLKRIRRDLSLQLDVPFVAELSSVL